MKSTLIATLGLLTMAVPASAGYVLDAEIYAREYCNLLDLGWGKPAASEYAIGESIIPGLPVKVLHDGGKVDADVVVAYAAGRYRCPQHH